MERWTSDDPCELVDQLAESIRPGLWLNLLVRDIDDAVDFQVDVLGARAVYVDRAFAIMLFEDTYWMLHSEDTYSEHPIRADLRATIARGTGCELRLQNCDPDQAEARARLRNGRVMEPTKNKPHGLRECFLVDGDGYVWVPSILKHSDISAPME
jgi:catechol 2,3-dioxygenase-like lactoylglutathione lyase family enzyme